MPTSSVVPVFSLSVRTSAPITSTDGPPHARKPLASQRSAGGDMSIMFFVQPGCPSRFASSDQHRVKGLNAETIARVILPAPPWLTAPDYSPLRTDPADPSPSIFFSLNLFIYNQQIEVERQDGLEESVDSGLLTYTIPALIVRDQGYSAVFSFTGPVVGPGPALLHKEFVPALDDVQLKCCGFVQLTTFLAPGNPRQNTVQRFPSLPERRDTQFQSNVLLTCTGKVAGLLAVRSSSSNHTPFEEIKAKFTARRPAASPTPLPAATPASASTPGESMPSRPASGADYTPPAKRPRQSPTSPITIPSSGTHPSAGSSSSQETVDEPEPSCAGNQAPTASFIRPLAPANHLPAPTLDTITAAVSESSNRPSRNRHPPKNKYLEEVSKV
ncbi:hypothetical protein EDB81DRAFT_848626 [Dactylonectria macrodidyma]|uniref:Uncharacterized protein n=1 Tax=Dactylonectria macrodidyma TaxID=307937 RepID=A0A9P9IBN9_9HYPO|nr:hypothetical protein EDB81DRAFT_848626 [Dactylonectria macrodidyma]